MKFSSKRAARALPCVAALALYPMLGLPGCSGTVDNQPARNSISIPRGGEASGAASTQPAENAKAKRAGKAAPKLGGVAGRKLQD